MPIDESAALEVSGNRAAVIGQEKVYYPWLWIAHRPLVVPIGDDGGCGAKLDCVSLVKSRYVGHVLNVGGVCLLLGRA